MKRLLLVGVVASIAVSATQSNAKSQLVWVPAPAALPRGARLAVLSGDPAKPGPYVIRLRIPPAYVVPPHSHATDEHMTVIEGALTMGRGTDENFGPVMVLGRDKSIITPASVVHYLSTTQGATVQISAQGPFQITYANPAADPRN